MLIYFVTVNYIDNYYMKERKIFILYFIKYHELDAITARVHDHFYIFKNRLSDLFNNISTVLICA